MAHFANIQTVTVGNFKVTYLPDGGGLIAPTVMYPASAAKGWGAHQRFLDDQGRIVVTIGGFLIETGNEKIIIDLGFGPQTVEFPGFGLFMGGKLMESLAQTGVKPTEITTVIYSHMHLDHVGWTSSVVDGVRQLTFPNARHLCTQVEWDFWQGDQSGLGPNPEAVVQPLQNHIQYIKGGDSIVPGMTVLATPGHTPGHISFHLDGEVDGEVDGGAEQLYLIIDLLHSEVQFYEPDWSVVFDIDPALARQTREAMCPRVAQPNILVGDGHFANQVFGRLQRAGDGWQWNAL